MTPTTTPIEKKIDSEASLGIPYNVMLTTPIGTLEEIYRNLERLRGEAVDVKPVSKSEAHS